MPTADAYLLQLQKYEVPPTAQPEPTTPSAQAAAAGPPLMGKGPTVVGKPLVGTPSPSSYRAGKSYSTYSLTTGSCYDLVGLFTVNPSAVQMRPAGPGLTMTPGGIRPGTRIVRPGQQIRSPGDN